MSATPEFHVLVIDDERAVRDQVCGELEAAGHACHAAEGAAGAYELLDQFTPELIIADINLAGHSGIELCEQIRRRTQLADVPVMFLSATQVPDIIRRRAPMGAASYFLRKPFEPAVLVELAGKVLGARELAAASG